MRDRSRAFGGRFRSIAGGDAAAPTLLPAPSAYWKYNDDLTDSSGNGRTLTGSPSYVTGKYGDALNGTALFATQPFLTGPLAGNTFSISIWVNKATGTGTRGGDVIVKDATGFLNARLELATGSGDPTVNFTINDVAVGGVTISQNVVLADGWHHVAGVCNAGAMTLYVDGVSIGTADATTFSVNSFSALGSATFAGGSSGNARAASDDLAIWNGVALTPIQVAAIAAAVGDLSTLL